MGGGRFGAFFFSKKLFLVNDIFFLFLHEVSNPIF